MLYKKKSSQISFLESLTKKNVVSQEIEEFETSAKHQRTEFEKPSEKVKEEKDNREKKQMELMQQVRQQFRVSGTKFYFKDQMQRLAFKDKGKRMVSAVNDERIAQAMATIAEAKGWKTIRVSGHPDFKREVWMEADLRGMKVRGFKPREEDLQELELRRDQRSKNMVAVEKEKPQTPQKDIHLNLSDKAKVIAAVAAEVITDKIKDPKKKNLILKEINKRLEQYEKDGNIPSVPVYDKNAESALKNPERVLPQIEPNIERSR